MWPSLKRNLGQAGWLAASLGLLYGAYLGITQVVSIDALAPFRTRPLPANADAGVTLKDVTIGVWNGGQKVASAQSSDLMVYRDRSRMILSEVEDGKLYPQKGEPYQFQAAKAEFGLFMRVLSLEGGVRVKGKDLNVATSLASWDERKSLLMAPGSIEGSVGGGEVKGKGLRADLARNTGRIGPLYWAGPVASLLGQAPATQATKKRWEFRGDDFEWNGDIRVYKNGHATDGEVIVKAPRLEHNRRTDVLVATGGVRFWGEEVNMAAPQVTVYRKESRAVATGTVFLYVKSEAQKGLKEEPLTPIPVIDPGSLPDAPSQAAASRQEQRKLDEEVRSTSNLRKYPAAIRAQEITYFYQEGSRRALIKGNPQARQELDSNRWRMVWAHEGDYDGEGDWLTLKSRPGQRDCRVRASTGDNVTALEVRVSTKENDDRLSAKGAQGVSYIDDEDEPGGTGGSGGGSPPPPLPGRV